MKKKGLTKIFLGVMFMALTIALGGCRGDKTGDENSSKITIGIPQDLEESLDPHKAVAAGTKEVLFNIFEGLVKPDSDGNLNPAIASDVNISDDGKVYTFILRENVKFHDGSVVTAEDVKYSIDKCADADNGSLLVPAFSNIESVTIVDEKTVEVTLVDGDTDFLAYFTTAIIPKNNANPDTNPIGTGPYKYVSRSPQENFIVEKFEDYWGEKAHIENVVFKICANADTIVMELQGKGIDMFCRLTSAQIEQLGPDYEIYEGTMNLVQAMYLNNGVEPFNNELVREALCYAVNPQEIMEFMADGKGTELGSSMFPAFGKYYMPELNDVYTVDYDKAKDLLKQAGYENGFEFTITVPSNYQPHIDTAQVIVEQLKNINVTAKIELVEWNTWVEDVYSGRQFEATVVGVDASNLTAGALLDRFESTAGKNFINYNNEAYDIALNNARKSADDAEKTKYYKECLTILNDSAANVYIQDLAEFVAINKKYAGYEFYPLYVQDISKLYIVE